MDEFKFQSILADDFLEFYLEYFPELKERKVDSIPGKQGVTHRLLGERGELGLTTLGKTKAGWKVWVLWGANPDPQAWPTKMASLGSRAVTYPALLGSVCGASIGASHENEISPDPALPHFLLFYFLIAAAKLRLLR